MQTLVYFLLYLLNLSHINTIFIIKLFFKFSLLKLTTLKLNGKEGEFMEV